MIFLNTKVDKTILIKPTNNLKMAYSTCCGAHTNYPEIGICPDCLEHCDWEQEDKDEIEKDFQSEENIDEEKINKL